MAFDIIALKHLAHLARIGLSEADCAALGGELEPILALVDQLREADVGGVAPMAHPLALTQRMRPDEVTEKPDRDRLQRNAPQVRAGLYIVPRVIDSA